MIAGVNMANLSLVRMTQRGRELALRSALGASRSDLILMSLAESLLLSLSGTAIGALLSVWLTQLLISIAPSHVPRLEEATPDATLFVFTAAVFLFTTVLLAVFPAWKISSGDPQNLLSTVSRGNTASARAGNFRAFFVSSEVALGTVLVITAGLLLTSLHRVLNVPRGFESDNVLIFDIKLPAVKYNPLVEQVSFSRRVHDKIASVPGVTNVATASVLPLDFQRQTAPVIKEGSGLPPDQIVSWPRVSANYFSVLKIQLRQGRLFRDEGEQEPVAVVNESAARVLWPGEYPIGKRVAHVASPRTLLRVVGVVGDVRAAGLERPPSPLVYRAFWQRGGTEFSVVTRAGIESEALMSTIREVIRKIDPEVPAPELRTMSALVKSSVERRSFQAFLLTFFAMIATLLAALGVYAVISQAMLQRRKEIGIRIVLGADQREVRKFMLRSGMTPIVLGLGLGLVAASLVGRLLKSMLFEVGTVEPITFLTASLLLLFAGGFPCWIIARRAGRTNPVSSLRFD